MLLGLEWRCGRWIEGEGRGGVCFWRFAEVRSALPVFVIGLASCGGQLRLWHALLALGPRADRTRVSVFENIRLLSKQRDVNKSQ